MTAQILDCKSLAKQIQTELKCGGTPCLAVVLCSNDPASEIYVNRKRKLCEELGFRSFQMRPEPTDLLRRVKALNDDHSVHGILVQLPIPISVDRILDAIDPLKDVDGFSPINTGLLLQGRPRFVPCTPAGIHRLLVENRIETNGKRVAIINRSNIVGKPLGALLCQDITGGNATVTLCHDHTPPDDLQRICLESDIIVVAVGKPKFIKADMVRSGQTVIDVGINRVDGKIVGDVDFDPVSEKVSALTCVPNGIGLLTTSMLMHNLVKAYNLRSLTQCNM